MSRKYSPEASIFCRIIREQLKLEVPEECADAHLRTAQAYGSCSYLLMLAVSLSDDDRRYARDEVRRLILDFTDAATTRNTGISDRQTNED